MCVLGSLSSFSLLGTPGLSYTASSLASFIFQTTMVSRLCLLVVAACAGWVAGQDADYCNFTPEHTLCKFSGRGDRCGPQVRGSGVSREDAAAIVALHNQLRSNVARGEETRGAPGPQPPGANIKTLVSASLILGSLLNLLFITVNARLDTFVNVR